MSYIGTEPKDIRSFGRTKFDYTATQGQTAFTGADDDGKVLAFTAGQIEVYVNGILMDDSDFTTTGTGTVTLASAANLNDVINIVSFETNIPDSNYVPATGGTFTGDVTHTGAFTSQGIDDNANATAITIDSSENVLVGKTAIGLSTTGIDLRSNGLIQAIRDGGTPVELNRQTSVGTLIDLRKDNTTVGSLGIQSTGFYVDGEPGHAGLRFAGNEISPRDNGADADDTVSLGESDKRFKDLYLSGGVYLGGTAAVNHLDDYEEGTWTPQLTINSSTSGITYTSRSAAYTKIGELVFVEGDIQLSSRGTNGGTVRIGSLPFLVDDRTSGTSLDGGASLCAFQANTSGLYSPITLIGRGGTGDIDMRAATTDGGDLSPALQHSSISNSFSCRFALTYRTG